MRETPKEATITISVTRQSLVIPLSFLEIQIDFEGKIKLFFLLFLFFFYFNLLVKSSRETEPNM